MEHCQVENLLFLRELIEAGKPIGVVGIDQVTTKLHDGQRVQVDGTAGVIRLLS